MRTIDSSALRFYAKSALLRYATRRHIFHCKRAIRICREAAPVGVRTASHHRACCERCECFEESFPPLLAIASRAVGPYGVFVQLVASLAR